MRILALVQSVAQAACKFSMCAGRVRLAATLLGRHQLCLRAGTHGEDLGEIPPRSSDLRRWGAGGARPSRRSRKRTFHEGEYGAPRADSR